MSKSKDELCKSDDYSLITEKDVPTDENFIKDYEENHIFHMTEDEYISELQFYKAHKECMRDPETGWSRFGAIGGGISKRYYTSGDKRSIIMKCGYCKESMNLSSNDVSLLVLSSEEIEEMHKRYVHHYDDSMTEVEYLRFKKFCEDRPNEEISVGFMGTGLGSLINVKSETTGEYADITDTDCW